MFATQTVLLLRALPRPASLLSGLFNLRRRYHSARSVMEVKQHLLRCVRRIKPELFPVPTVIMVDAGANNADIKSELERWLDRHPRLRRVRVILPPAQSWVRRFVWG